MEKILTFFAKLFYKKQNLALAGSQWIPIPLWLNRWLKRYPLQTQVVIYARILEGKDLSELAPNEFGCAESVSRILTQFGLLHAVCTGTWTLNQELKNSRYFQRISEYDVTPGTIIIATTGEGNGQLKNGHVGIVDENKRVWSNNSYTGKWSNHLNVMFFKNYYGLIGGFPIHYYKIIS